MTSPLRGKKRWCALRKEEEVEEIEFFFCSFCCRQEKWKKLRRNVCHELTFILRFPAFLFPFFSCVMYGIHLCLVTIQKKKTLKLYIFMRWSLWQSLNNTNTNFITFPNKNFLSVFIVIIFAARVFLLFSLHPRLPPATPNAQRWLPLRGNENHLK